MRQIPFELLREDKIFRAWLKAVPKQPQGSYRLPPWRVYVQKEIDGRWAKLDFETYAQAYNWIIKRRMEFWDFTICCKVQQFKPPVVRKKSPTPSLPNLVTKHYWPGVEGHQWCGFCRRPTIFRHFSRHHVVPSYYLNPEDKYCTICGARKSFVKIFHTALSPIDDLWIGGVPERVRERVALFRSSAL